MQPESCPGHLARADVLRGDDPRQLGDLTGHRGGSADFGLDEDVGLNHFGALHSDYVRIVNEN